MLFSLLQYSQWAYRNSVKPFIIHHFDDTVSEYYQSPYQKWKVTFWSKLYLVIKYYVNSSQNGPLFICCSFLERRKWGHQAFKGVWDRGLWGMDFSSHSRKTVIFCPALARIFHVLVLSRPHPHNPSGGRLRRMDISVALIPTPMEMCKMLKKTPILRLFM